MEKTIYEKRLEFLDETIKFYSEDITRRSVILDKDGDEMCCYRTFDADGNVKSKCAIGRVIPDEAYVSSIESLSVNTNSVLNILPKEIKDLGVSFLGEVQTLHDTPHYWNMGGGLTGYGHNWYNYIFDMYCTNPKPVGE